MKLVLALLVVAAMATSPTPWQLHRAVGDVYTYQMESRVDTFGEGPADGEAMSETSGVSMSMKVYVTVLESNKTHSVLSLNCDSFVENANTTGADGEEPQEIEGFLGEDVIFVQALTGEISDVHTVEEDDEELLAVKLGVINQFQVAIGAEGTTISRDEDDVVGVLRAEYLSRQDNGTLQVRRDFDTDDIKKFADPAVDNPELGREVVVDHESSVWVCPQGRIQRTHSIQRVVLGAEGLEARRRRSLSNENTTGLDVDVEGLGESSMTLLSVTHADARKRDRKPRVRGTLLSHMRRVIAHRDFMDSKVVADNLASIVQAPLQHQHLGRVDHDVVRAALEVELRNVAKYSEEARGRLYSIAVLAHRADLLEDAVSRAPESLSAALTAVHLTERALHSRTSEWLASLAHTHESEDVRQRALFALGSAAAFDGELVQHLRHHEPRVLRAAMDNAGIQDGKIVLANDFPYSRKYQKRIQLGGSSCNAYFEGYLTAGSNLNCKKPANMFNYRAEGQVSAGFKLFRWRKALFTADAQYGKLNGAPLRNNVLVKLWGKTIYNKNLKAFNCVDKTKRIFQVSPGFKVSVTIVVVVVPVRFSAAATLTLGANWGYAICDSTLSANIYVDPSAQLTISGGASVSVLIAKAGITVSASYKVTLVPKLEVLGTQCQIAFRLDLQQQPLSARLFGWYKTRKLRWKRWRPRITWSRAKEKTFWKYISRASTKNLYTKTYQIGK